MTRYAAPGTEGSLMSYATGYDHWIDDEYVAPAGGRTRAGPVSWWVVVAVRSGRVTGRV
jgi:hypothetical protein